MSQFKGPKPKAQPRSLRSIAESKNGKGGFEYGHNDDHAMNPPIPYDVAEAARPTQAQARRGVTPADPQPFDNVRKR